MDTAVGEPPLGNLKLPPPHPPPPTPRSPGCPRWSAQAALPGRLEGSARAISVSPTHGGCTVPGQDTPQPHTQSSPVPRAPNTTAAHGGTALGTWENADGQSFPLCNLRAHNGVHPFFWNTAFAETIIVVNNR